MTEEEFEAYLDEARRDLAAKGPSFEARYGRWDISELSQRIDTHEVRRVTRESVMWADVVWIGAYYELGEQRAIIWGWADDKLPAAVRQRALPIKALADVTGQSVYAEDGPVQLPSGGDHVWGLAASAVRHLGALACIAVPNGRASVFLAVMGVRVDPRPPRAPNLIDRVQALFGRARVLKGDAEPQ